MQRLRGKRIAFVVANERVEEAEVATLREAILNSGAQVELIAPERGIVQAYRGLAPSGVFLAKRAIAQASPAEYDALVLPGAAALVQAHIDDTTAAFLRSFRAEGKAVAALGHGPLLLAQADVVKGRSLTSSPSLRSELCNAGALWVDQEVHVDGRLVTARRLEDLPAFCAMILDVFAWAPDLSYDFSWGEDWSTATAPAPPPPVAEVG